MTQPTVGMIHSSLRTAALPSVPAVALKEAFFIGGESGRLGSIGISELFSQSGVHIMGMDPGSRRDIRTGCSYGSTVFDDLPCGRDPGYRKFVAPGDIFGKRKSAPLQTDHRFRLREGIRRPLHYLLGGS